MDFWFFVEENWNNIYYIIVSQKLMFGQTFIRWFPWQQQKMMDTIDLPKFLQRMK